MAEYIRACYLLNIEIIQLNIFDSRTRRMRVERYRRTRKEYVLG